MKRRLTHLLAFSTALVLSSMTSPAARAWQTVIASEVTDGEGEGRDVAFTGDGDVLSAGKLAIGNVLFEQMLIVKYAGGAGTELWRKALHGTATSGFDGTLNASTWLAADGAGDVFVTGVLDNSTFFDASIVFYVGKLDGATGGELWRQEVAEGFAFDGALDAAGNVVAAGYVTVSDSGSAALVTKRAAATGAELWSTELRGSTSLATRDEAAAVAIDPAGDVVVAGLLEGTSPEFFVAKLSGATGTELWRKVIDEAVDKSDLAADVAVDSSGDVFAGGTLGQADSSDDDFFLVKLAGADGDELWRKLLAGTSGDGDLDSLAVDGAGDVVAGGYLANTGTDDVSLIAKFDGATGAELWRHEEALTNTGPFVLGVYPSLVAIDGADDVAARVSIAEGDIAILRLSGIDGAEASRHVFRDKDDVVAGSIAVNADGEVASVGNIIPKRSSRAMLTLKLGAEATGRKISVKDKAGDAAKRKVQVQVKDPQFVAGSPGGSFDPRLVGATFTLTNPTTAETMSTTLVATNWKGLGNPPGVTGYTYTDKKPLEGPCKSAKLKNGQWQVLCGGDQISFSLDEPSQGSLGAKLTIGTASSCVLFGGTVKKDVQAVGKTLGAFEAQDAPAPAACP
jgi:outer membrane protein assembly factor BamB